MNYWQRREAIQKQKYQIKTEKEIQRELIKIYKSAAKDINLQMVELYSSLMSEGNGEIKINDLYRYNRYYHMREAIGRRLVELGGDTLDVLDKKMEGMYKWTSSRVFESAAFDRPNDSQIDSMIRSMWEANGKHWSKNIWCSDGLNAEDRIANNMAKLQRTLEKGMIDCVSRGAPKDELVKELRNRFDVSFNEADRLARTELSYIQNDATLKSYQKAGIEKYEYLAEIDGRTSNICKELDGKQFNVSEAVVGVNYPPCHANCRSTTVAVIE